jgi:hypothetical protein
MVSAARHSVAAVRTELMSARPGGELAEVRDALTAAAGGHLRNVIRDPKLTCRVCAAPVGGFGLCWRCAQHRRVAGVADVVAPLTYAIADTPSAAVVHDYKNHPVRAVRQRHAVVVKRLLFLAITAHERCVGRVAGLAVSGRVGIPSLTNRPGVHPIQQMLRAMRAVDGSVVLTPGPNALCDRAIDPDKFALQATAGVAGRHVLVLDDTWTTGSNAQSAALTLRRAGAAAVSVIVVGRWLNPRFGATARFVATGLRREYDPDLCPVTGGVCP